MDQNKVWELKCKKCGHIMKARQKDIKMENGYKGTIACSNPECDYIIKTVVTETVDKSIEYNRNEMTGIITREHPKTRMNKKQRRRVKELHKSYNNTK